MKITTCPFCQTAYKVPTNEINIECPVCGNIWIDKSTNSNTNTTKKSSKNKLLLLTILLFIILISIYLIFTSKNKSISTDLNIAITELTPIPQFDGSFKININGIITNNSENTKPVPTIIIKLLNDKNEISDIKSVIPPITLIDSHQQASFKYLITPLNDDVAKAEISFESKDNL